MTWLAEFLMEKTNKNRYIPFIRSLVTTGCKHWHLTYDNEIAMRTTLYADGDMVHEVFYSKSSGDLLIYDCPKKLIDDYIRQIKRTIKSLKRFTNQIRILISAGFLPFIIKEVHNIVSEYTSIENLLDFELFGGLYIKVLLNLFFVVMAKFIRKAIRFFIVK